MPNPEDRAPIYVVEDDAAVLRSLCALLDAHGYEPIACTSAEHFLRIHDPEQRGCMVLDLRLPGMSGMQLQAHLRDIGAKIPIIVVTAHGDIPVAVQAMRAGAIDFIEKPARPDQLLKSIQYALGVLQNHEIPEIPKEIVAERLAKLTDREREVLGYLLQGKLNKEIAAALDLSQRTVEVHRLRIREKMQARGIADLIRMLG